MSKVTGALLVLRCDGGTIDSDTLGRVDIASGHYMRMLQVARSWILAGGEVELVTHEQCRGLTSYLVKYRELGAEVSFVTSDKVASEEEAVSFVKIAMARKEPKIVYLDGYQFSAAYQAVVFRSGLTTVVQVDSEAQGPFSAHFLVGGHLSAALLHIEVISPDTKRLFGTQYAPLAPEYSELAREAFQLPQVSRNLLITLGSSDTLRDTERCLNGLAALAAESESVRDWLGSVSIRVIVGAMNEHSEEIEICSKNLEKETGCSVLLLKNVKDMPEQMRWANIAFSATGGTVLELLCAGVPIVLQIIHPVQVSIARAMAQQKVCLVAGDSREIKNLSESAAEGKRIAFAIHSMANDLELRRNCVMNGRKLVDGKGADRITAALAEFLESE